MLQQNTVTFLSVISGSNECSAETGRDFWTSDYSIFSLYFQLDNTLNPIPLGNGDIMKSSGFCLDCAETYDDQTKDVGLCNYCQSVYNQI